MQKRLPILLSLFLSFSAISCSSFTKKMPYEVPTSHPKEGIETIAILGTNDIHGVLAAETVKTREQGTATGGTGDSTSIEYQRGGVAVLASFVKVLKKEMGSRLLWLDGGDEFQGTIESNMQKGQGMVRFFNLAQLDGAAIGNHEFDYGPEERSSDSVMTPNDQSSQLDPLGALKARMREANYPYLAANILDHSTRKLADFPNTFPSKLYTVGKLKVGVIGLSTLDTPKTTLATHIRSLIFSDLKEATLREAKSLREQGADVVIITSHVGLKCAPGKMPIGLILRKPDDPQGECGSDDEMVRLLRSLPSGTVDAVVAAHSHQIVHHWIAGVPVIQGGSFGRYFNVIYLSYDLNSKKLLPELARIEGPVPVCTQIFKNQNDCNGDRPAPKGGRGPLVQTVFHGEKIRSDSGVEALLQPILRQSAEIKNQLIAQAGLPIEHERFKESALGNLVSDAIRLAARADIALMNSGGIRAPLEQGKILYGNIFHSLPFDNSITKLKVTGKELRQILQIAESGSRGFSPISGAELRLIDPRYDAPSSDLNGNHTIEPWEINRLLDIRLLDGRRIQDDQTYLLATIDFLVHGGDDVGWSLKKIPAERVTHTDILVRNATLQHIQKLAATQGGWIHTATHPLLDPAHPRLVFEKPKSRSEQKKKRHKKKQARAKS